jgi:hypothetical protein
MGFITGVAVAGLLAVAGCGGDSDSSSTEASGGSERASDRPADPDVETRARQPLSRHQFEEIERLYRAQLAAEARHQGDIAKTSAATKRACRRVNREDRLLAAIVKTCDEMLDFFAELSQQNCASPKECAPVQRRAVAMLDRVLESLDEADAVIDQTVAGAACRRALTTPKIERLVKEMRDSVSEVATAMESGDERAIGAASQRFIAALSDYPSAAAARPVFKRFRQACAPDA